MSGTLRSQIRNAAKRAQRRHDYAQVLDGGWVRCRCGFECPAWDVWGDHYADAVLAVALDAIEEIGDEPHHVARLRAGWWTLKHPLTCRPTLFDCAIHAAFTRLDATPASEDGDYVVTVDADGMLIVGERVA